MAFIFHNIWDNPSLHLYPEYQWPCNRNRLIGGTYHMKGLFFRPIFWGISPQNMALYGTVPPLYDPEIPID